MWPVSEPVNQLFDSTYVCSERVVLVQCPGDVRDG